MIERRHKAAILLAAAALVFPLAAVGPAGAAEKKSDAPQCRQDNFRVIVDVGHTLEAPGATSARGVFEFEYNLNLAKDVERKLAETGFAKTELLVTEGPTAGGLLKRVVHANRTGADLFLSIHHDSVPDPFLEKWEYESVERSFSDRFRGHSIFISNNNGHAKASLAFGKLLGQALKSRELQYARHYTEAFMGSRRRQLVDAEAGVYRYDKLFVLRESRMPAVLLEAGSIINRDEELLMRTPERRALIAGAVADAVTAFCTQQSQSIARREKPARPSLMRPAMAGTSP